MTLHSRAAWWSTSCAAIQVTWQHLPQYADTPSRGCDRAHSQWLRQAAAVSAPWYSALAYDAGAAGGAGPKRQRAHCIGQLVCPGLVFGLLWGCSAPPSTEARTAFYRAQKCGRVVLKSIITYCSTTRCLCQ